MNSGKPKRTRGTVTLRKVFGTDRNKLRRLLREGARRHAKRDLEIAEEWAVLDADDLLDLDRSTRRSMRTSF
jgi:RNase P protein component